MGEAKISRAKDFFFLDPRSILEIWVREAIRASQLKSVTAAMYGEHGLLCPTPQRTAEVLAHGGGLNSSRSVDAGSICRHTQDLRRAHSELQK